MKLTEQELLGLKEMIRKSSEQTLEKYRIINKKEQKGSIVFLGDSMIEYLDVDKYLPHIGVINRGVAGATTAFIQKNLNNLLTNITPKKVFISIGSNDLVLLKASPKQAAQNIKNVLLILKNNYPNAQIYYLSATPVIKEGHKLYKKIYVAGRTNEEIQDMNRHMIEICKELNVEFIDQYYMLVDSEGYLMEAYTADGIHLNKKGYEVFSKKIDSQIKH